MEWCKDDLVLTDNDERVDVHRVYELLQPTYWAARRSLETVERLVRNSLCFSLVDQKAQVGFARVVTDFAAFSWLADFVIDPMHRGKGYGEWMLGHILEHPAIKDTQFVLQTRDAHSLYEKFGFRHSSALMSTPVTNL